MKLGKVLLAGLVVTIFNIIACLVLNIVLAFVYALINKGIPGKNKFVKGLVINKDYASFLSYGLSKEGRCALA